jgi:hypothetical protein
MGEDHIILFYRLLKDIENHVNDLTNRELFERFKKTREKIQEKFNESKNQKVFLNRMGDYIKKKKPNESIIKIYFDIKNSLEKLQYKKGFLTEDINKITGSKIIIDSRDDCNIYEAKYVDEKGEIKNVNVYYFGKINGSIKENDIEIYMDKYISTYQKFDHVNIPKILTFSTKERWFALESHMPFSYCLKKNDIKHENKLKIVGEIINCLTYLCESKVDIHGLSPEDVKIKSEVDNIRIQIVPRIKLDGELGYDNSQKSKKKQKLEDKQQMTCSTIGNVVLLLFGE